MHIDKKIMVILKAQFINYDGGPEGIWEEVCKKITS